MARRFLLRPERQWHPQPNPRIDENEARRHHTHNRERAATEAQGAAEDGGLAAIKLPPQPVAEDDLVLATDLALLVGEDSAVCGSHPQQPEQRRRGRHARDLLRNTVDVEGLVGEAEHCLLLSNRPRC